MASKEDWTWIPAMPQVDVEGDFSGELEVLQHILPTDVANAVNTAMLADPILSVKIQELQKRTEAEIYEQAENLDPALKEAIQKSIDDSNK